MASTYAGNKGSPAAHEYIKTSMQSSQKTGRFSSISERFPDVESKSLLMDICEVPFHYLLPLMHVIALGCCYDGFVAVATRYASDLESLKQELS